MDKDFEIELEAFVGKLGHADGVISLASHSLKEAAHNLGQLSSDSLESRRAAALEAATEHFLGTKKVSRPMRPEQMAEDDWQTMRQLAALRELGRLKTRIDVYSRQLAWRLHKDSGVTGQRLAEPLGVSNATTSAWIREGKARGDE